MKNFSFIAVHLALLLNFSVYANQPSIESARINALVWLIKQQNADGAWGQSGNQAAATFEVLQAMRNASMQASPQYARGLSWMANYQTSSVDYLSRKVITLAESGMAPELLSEVSRIRDMQNNYGNWGGYQGEHASVIDSSFALKALYVAEGSLDNEDHIGFSTQLVYKGLQSGNNGLSFTGHNNGKLLDPEITPSAMGLVGLSTLKKGRSASNVKSFMQRISAWLMAQQNADGSFLKDSEDSASAVMQTALSVNGLKELDHWSYTVSGYDHSQAIAKGLNYIFEQQNSNGSWANSSYQTALAINSLEPIELVDSDLDGIPDVIEAALGSNPSVADSIEYLASTGNHISELFSVDPYIVQVTAGTTFGTSLIANGGQAPYTWTVVNMPTGVTASNDQILGTIHTAGNYVFSISATDANGDVAMSAGRIEVIGSGDITLDTDGDGYPSIWELANNLDPLDASDANAASGLAQTLDTDSDGLSDEYEIANGLNYRSSGDASQDSDNDGLTNLVEHQIGTDPNNPDTDGDGMADGWERSYALNPLESSDAGADNDKDGLTNRNEYLYNGNPKSQDTDGDKVLDKIEADWGLALNSATDSDMDGMPNDWETVNSLNSGVSNGDDDADSDLLTNLQEFELDTDPQNSDTDLDGTSDGAEVAVGRNPKLNEPVIILIATSILL